MPGRAIFIVKKRGAAGLLAFASFAVFLVPARAELLEGYVEDGELPERTRGQVQEQPEKALQGHDNQLQYPASTQRSSLEILGDFAPSAPMPRSVLPPHFPEPMQKPVAANANSDGSADNHNTQRKASQNGGQDEYWVDWQAWDERIYHAVFDPLHDQVVWGHSGVSYIVTRGGQIIISNAYGRSGNLLARQMLSLQGTPVLKFPAASRLNTHAGHRVILGPPLPGIMNHRIYKQVAPEHVTRQW